MHGLLLENIIQSEITVRLIVLHTSDPFTSFLHKSASGSFELQGNVFESEVGVTRGICQ